MKSAKAMTVRLSADQAELLETVAGRRQPACVEVIRAAIAQHIERRKKDKAFRKA